LELEIQQKGRGIERGLKGKISREQQQERERKCATGESLTQDQEGER
jgi:hypothetical protein